MRAERCKVCNKWFTAKQKTYKICKKAACRLTAQKGMK